MKKGFTLIELLAVIVILAIIALIASPIVVGLIEDSNKQAAERSTESVVSAAKTRYALHQMDPTNTDYALDVDAKDLDLDNPPTAGTVNYAAGSVNGDIGLTDVIFGSYSCDYAKATGAVCTKS